MSTNINLISQEAESKEKLSGKTSLIISILLVVLAAGAYVALKGIAAYYNSQAKALEQEIKVEQGKLAGSDFQDLVDFQERMNLADRIIADRFSFESYLKNFSTFVLPEVRLSSFVLDEAGGTLEIAGRAASFDALSKELILLRSCKSIQSFEFKDAKEMIGTESQPGGVDFNLSAIISKEK